MFFDKLKKDDFLNSNNENPDPSGINGERLANRIREIAEIGLTKDMGSNRIGYSQEENHAKELVIKWMNEAGLQTKTDAAGNVVGRMKGLEDGLPCLMAGSHLDTVPNGGHFDGVLGVLTALEVAEAWRKTKYTPIHPYEVVIFSEEEGSRFNSGLTGSKAMMGDLSLDELQHLIDYQGVPFEEVMNQSGISVEDFLKAKRDVKEIDTFVEVHIEQGKQLEKNEESVGIVNGITGHYGMTFTLGGEASHAGNTPMDERKDALVAASEIILKVNSLPSEVSPTAVATVGQLNVYPNGSNVIPGEVTFSVDIRDTDLQSMDKLFNLIVEEALKISSMQNIKVSWKETIKESPVLMKENMLKIQTKSLQANQISPSFIPSGAAHDAMVLGRHVPTAMFFVRSKNGISHNPKEWTSIEDCVKATYVLKDFLETLDKS